VKQKLNIILFASVFSLAVMDGISYLPLFELSLSSDEGGFILMAPSTSVSFLVTTLLSLAWVNCTRQFVLYKKVVTLAISIIALFGLLNEAATRQKKQMIQIECTNKVPAMLSALFGDSYGTTRTSSL
jgi:Na+/proline symporter